MSGSLDAMQARAYTALAEHAAVIERSGRMRMSFTGEKAKEALGGLLTNDVVSLTTGTGMRAAALTPKGRVIALLRVLDRGDDILLDADPAAGAGFTAMIRKFVNPRLARHAELTASTGCLGVYGPQSADVVATLTGTAAESLLALGPHASLTMGAGDDALTIVRSVDLRAMGFDIVASRARISGLGEMIDAMGLPRADEEVATIARVEAGLPRWGVEMDDETIPQEANLDTLDAISFNKGCYTGQEVVARIHFRGHVNKHLRWLISEEPLAAGAVVQDLEGKEVGAVRTAVVSPARGALAIAMVRREVAPGSEVMVLAGGRAVRARSEAITA